MIEALISGTNERQMITVEITPEIMKRIETGEAVEVQDKSGKKLPVPKVKKK